MEKEEDLDDFWLHMTTLGDGLQKGDIFGFISSLYFFFGFLKSDDNLSEEDKSFQFIIEETSDLFFWTTASPYLVFMTNNNNIFFNEFEFKSDGKQLTFKLYKFKHFEKRKSVKKNRIYKFIPEDEILKLQKIGEEMSLELIEISEEHEFNKKIVMKIISSIDGFIKVIEKYEETYILSDIMEDFSHELSANIDDVVNLNFEDIHFFEKFFENLNSWLLKSFFTGIGHIGDFDEVIREDISSIVSIIGGVEPAPTLSLKI
jgi:hypothetical protein